MSTPDTKSKRKLHLMLVFSIKKSSKQKAICQTNINEKNGIISILICLTINTTLQKTSFGPRIKLIYVCTSNEIKSINIGKKLNHRNYWNLTFSYALHLHLFYEKVILGVCSSLFKYPFFLSMDIGSAKIMFEGQKLQIIERAA